ncbi:MAG TPA: VOC family protein [Gammaproteobacteria bacterium]|nr:VOC family protein [Gammaproteobacteria bacterium]
MRLLRPFTTLPRRAPRAAAFLCAVAASATAGVLAQRAIAQAPAPEPTEAHAPATVRPLLWQRGMKRSDIGEVNVFRRFSSDKDAKMRDFYHEVLGLPVLASSALGGSQMIRYPLGSSEVKLFPVTPISAPNKLRVSEGVGMRLLTFFYTDQPALVARLEYYGYKAPQFRPDKSRAGATGVALVQDPDGEWVELVIEPDASDETLHRFEIGITASDLDKSRAFYRDFMGLAEQPPIRDETLGTTRYAYKNGTTTINLWSFGGSLPKDSQTGGMQYIVWDVVAVDDLAHARGAQIDRPLSNPGQMRTVWLLDPDGVTNYFAEYAGNVNAPPPH